nr:FAD-dependent oxidoreductase [Rhizobium sp. CSW-27]
MTVFSPFDITLWYATAAPAPNTERLQGSVRADVCIVGAGYTGLTTALELARAGVNVVVLEREEAGFGGSGRNAGHCTPTFTHYSLPELRRMLGEPWAERLIERQTRANDRVATMIRDYQIDCEWVQNGYVMGAPHRRALDTIRQKVETYNAVGARTRFIDRDEVADLTGSPRFHGGWFHEEAGHLNPLGYARGLARAVLQEGAKLFTGSAATSCERDAGGGWRVAAAAGHVIADKVIFTTGAYTVGGWPKLDRTFKIQRVFVAATQVLSPETRARVLPNNTTIHDGRGDIYVYKYNAEGRIVASMFPMGRRGRDMAYTRQVMSERLKMAAS